MPTAFDQADLDKTVAQIRAKVAAEEDQRSALTKALDAINTLARGLVGKKTLAKADGDPGTGDSDKPWPDEQDVSDDDCPTDVVNKADSDGVGESDANGGDTTESKPTDIEESWDKLDKADGDDLPPWMLDDDDDDDNEMEKARRQRRRLGKAAETHIHLHQHGSDDDGMDDDDDDAGAMANGNGGSPEWTDDDEANALTEEEDRSDDQDIADAILQVLQDHIDRHDDNGGGDDSMDKSGKNVRGLAKTQQHGAANVVQKFLTKSLQAQSEQEKRLLALEKAHAWTVRELKKSRQERSKQTNALTAMGQAMLKMHEGQEAMTKSQEAITKSLEKLHESQDARDALPQDSRYERVMKSQLGAGLRQSSSYDKRKAADALIKGVITNQDHAQWKYRGIVPAALTNNVA